MVLMVTPSDDDDAATPVPFPPDVSGEATDEVLLGSVLETDPEDTRDEVDDSVGRTEASVLESVTAGVPGVVAESLGTLLEEVSLGTVGVSIGVGMTATSELDSADGVTGSGVDSGGAVTDGTGWIETSCASVVVAKSRLINNKDRMMMIRQAAIEDVV